LIKRDRISRSRRPSPSLREACSIVPVLRCCYLIISAPQSRRSYTAVPTIPVLCCGHILPAHAGSGARCLVCGWISRSERVGAKAGTSPGTWIRGSGYDEFSLAEKRHPTRWDLDAAAPLHPVKLTHRSGHGHVLNTLGLPRKSGIRDPGLCSLMHR
jgi:hypothetical protein